MYYTNTKGDIMDSIKHLGTITLSSKRLLLRRIYEEDALEIYKGFRNQEGFLYYANKKPVTLYEEQQSLINIDLKYENQTYYNWVITLKESNAIIGGINGHYSNNEVLINYAIDERYQGHGYMTEALKTVTRFFINDVHLDRIYCGCCSDNIASKKVIEKNNMKLIEIKKDYLKLQDGLHDMLLYILEK